MARVRCRDTKPEMIVRRALHLAGLRYRLHDRRLPGNPDVVFRSRRTVVFIHGCFWHRHGDPNCKLARLPKSRREFWIPKLEGNRQRDLRNTEMLRAMGWRVFVVWECEVRNSICLRILAETIKSSQIERHPCNGPIHID